MMMGFELIIILAIGAFIYSSGWRPQFTQTNSGQTSPTALGVLKTRYARGEITQEQYQEMRRALDG